MNEFVTWQSLGSYAGAVMMVTLITQFLKQLPLVGRLHPQLTAYAAALLLMLAAEWFGGSFSLSSALLTAVNAVMVALAAGGTYDAATVGMIPQNGSQLPDEEI